MDSEPTDETVKVSTHAPTRGATALRFASDSPPSFNPRAHEGRDFTLPYQRGREHLFQPTRPRGARRHYSCAQGRCAVSTHAPTRGATITPLCKPPYNGVSTHAPTRGATEWTSLTIPSCWFQPTRPRGARHAVAKLMIAPTTFQPTRPRGARLRYTKELASGRVSTHAPTRGATVWWRPHSSHDVFQPTRPRGARLPLGSQSA